MIKKLSEYSDLTYYDVGFINEGGLSKIYSYTKNNDFGIISGWKKYNPIEINIKNTHEILNYLNNNKIGPYILRGKWKEAPEDMDYDKTKELDMLVPMEEDSVFVVRPTKMTTIQFIDIMETLRDKYKQDAVLIGVDGDISLYYKNKKLNLGNKTKFGSFSDIYSELKRLWKKGRHIPFTFEGLLSPKGMVDAYAFNKFGIRS